MRRAARDAVHGGRRCRSRQIRARCTISQVQKMALRRSAAAMSAHPAPAGPDCARVQGRCCAPTAGDLMRAGLGASGDPRVGQPQVHGSRHWHVREHRCLARRTGPKPVHMPGIRSRDAKRGTIGKVAFDGRISRAFASAWRKNARLSGSRAARSKGAASPATKSCPVHTTASCGTNCPITRGRSGCPTTARHTGLAFNATSTARTLSTIVDGAVQAPAKHTCWPTSRRGETATGWSPRAPHASASQTA